MNLPVRRSRATWASRCCWGIPVAPRLRCSSVTAFFLIEYLIYIAVLVVVLGVAFAAFYRSLDHSRDLVRNSEAILSTLQAGEQWRRDIRRASGRPVAVEEAGVTALEIPTTNGTVAYIFADGALWKKHEEVPAKLLISKVLGSRMIFDTNRSVSSWRWEIELQTRRKAVRVKPLFTFQAVPMEPL